MSVDVVVTLVSMDSLKWWGVEVREAPASLTVVADGVSVMLPWWRINRVEVTAHEPDPALPFSAIPGDTSGR